MLKTQVESVEISFYKTPEHYYGFILHLNSVPTLAAVA